MSGWSVDNGYQTKFNVHGTLKGTLKQANVLFNGTDINSYL